MIKKVLLTVGGLLLVLLVIVLCQKVDPFQYDPAIVSHTFPKILVANSLSIDSLWDVVGENKTVPEGFEKAALVAYSAYPQLRDVKIEMILTDSGAPMESNFELSTLFGKRQHRIYQILLNNSSDSFFDPVLLKNLPFNAQVGILAHELGHVDYYRKYTTLALAKWGLMYLISMDFRAVHERSTDLMPVYHGLGFQIHEYAWYVRNDPTCKPMYESFGKLFMDRFYMTDKEIVTEIRKHRLYQDKIER